MARSAVSVPLHPSFTGAGQGTPASGRHRGPQGRETCTGNIGFHNPSARLQSEMNPSGPLRSGLWNRTGVTTAGWDAPPAIGANRRRAGSPSLARDAHLRHRRTEPEDRRVHPRVERSGRGAPSSDSPSSDSDAQSVCYRLRPPSEPPGASRRQPQLPCPPAVGCGKSRLVVTNCERGSSPFHTFPPIRRAANPRGFAAIGFLGRESARGKGTPVTDGHRAGARNQCR